MRGNKKIQEYEEKLSQKTLLDEIHNDLQTLCSEKNRLGQQKYFKEEVKFIGCTNTQTRTVAKKYWRIIKNAEWEKGDVLALSEDLLRKGTFEEGLVGLDLTEHVVKDLGMDDFEVFEGWLNKYVNNWAHTDEICPHIIGELLEAYPELAERVFGWTKSENRWVRRASAVTYVLHGRNGKFMKQIFNTAEALIGDRDDMVQKGVGWMLKEASKADEETVINFLLKHKDEASRLVLRYATEKVSSSNRKRVLEIG